MQGQLIAGRYRLVDSIGSGGMGRVWRAHDEVLHRAVAVKELTAALYVAESDRAILLARTRAEARAAARINHSAVVTVHDVLEHDGRPWIVMELVEGSSLADAVREHGRIEPREAARIGLWVLRALRAAHAAGVLHRDVKPGNVLLGRDGRVLLTDFGIAQIEGDSTITRTGEVVGSVDYLAPERVRGHDPGPAADLWALGATLYTAVEGRSPFRRTSPLTTMQAVVEEDAAEPRHAEALTPVIAALLRKEPERRPVAEEAEQMLAEAAEGRRPGSAQAFVPTQGSGVPGLPGTGYPSGAYPSGTGAYGTGSGGHTTTPYGSGSHASGGCGTGSGPGAVYGTGSTAGASYGTGNTAGASYGTGPDARGRGASGTGGSGVGVTGRAAVAGRPRRLRTLALVVAVAAVVGGLGAVAAQQWNTRAETGRSRGDVSPAPGTSGGGSATTSTGPGEDGTPAGWERQDDPLGFSLSLPKGWKRKPFGDTSGHLKQIDYTPDDGVHFVRVSIDTSPDFSDAYEHQQDLDQQLSGRLVDYRRVELRRNTYRDRPGSLWGYTWTALPKQSAGPGPRRAVEETYSSRDGTEYALYMSAPVADWPQAEKDFKSVLQGWRPDSA
ncbi:serine/threonine protein kinase [Streptomyces sp. J2-1]|uniref:serine/threonine-protein kinase n=1 Tax=Streptomyces corallincola TaxID=2851888 RepID=UPI001C37ECAC|nr:serine/threonine-protein kinase [Streptomyces corallincola]MBV2355757.1 serine/threonine protein kinase [Streptomyces corallincola]